MNIIKMERRNSLGKNPSVFNHYQSWQCRFHDPFLSILFHLPLSKRKLQARMDSWVVWTLHLVHPGGRLFIMKGRIGAQCGEVLPREKYHRFFPSQIRGTQWEKCTGKHEKLFWEIFLGRICLALERIFSKVSPEKHLFHSSQNVNRCSMKNMCLRWVHSISPFQTCLTTEPCSVLHGVHVKKPCVRDTWKWWRL